VLRSCIEGANDAEDDDDAAAAAAAATAPANAANNAGSTNGGTDSNREETPEEKRVIGESKKAVALAQQCLLDIDPTTLVNIRRKQAARVLLTKEGDIIRNMLHEGMLTIAQAEEMLEVVTEDSLRVDKDRRVMKAEKEKELAQNRREQVRSIRVSSTASLGSGSDAGTGGGTAAASPSTPSKMVPFDVE
jgi:hypothetical protein